MGDDVEVKLACYDRSTDQHFESTGLFETGTKRTWQDIYRVSPLSIQLPLKAKELREVQCPMCTRALTLKVFSVKAARRGRKLIVSVLIPIATLFLGGMWFLFLSSGLTEWYWWCLLGFNTLGWAFFCIVVPVRGWPVGLGEFVEIAKDQQWVDPAGRSRGYHYLEEVEKGNLNRRFGADIPFTSRR